MPENRFHAIYTKGRFLWSAITEANPSVVLDEVSMAGLVARGFTFEATFTGVPEHWISLPY
jgi:hypothetical protein